MHMKNRVTGIGGLFFKCEDPKKIKEWYRKHLGLPMDNYGASFRWIDPQNPDAKVHALIGLESIQSRHHLFPSQRETIHVQLPCGKSG